MKKIVGIGALVAVIFFGIQVFTQEKAIEGKSPFSFVEIDAIESFDVAEPSFLQASDGVQLAYYKFTNVDDENIVILYAGAGLYGNTIYQWVAKTLHEQYGIGVYIFDIRGHGHSQGPRGDAISMQQVWDDVAQAVEIVKHEHVLAKIYLCGHSSGAGLIINYAANIENKLEDGYIFVAPYLGPKSGSMKEDTGAFGSFVTTIRPWVYILGMLFPSSSMIHWNAVFFNYPAKVLELDPLIVPVYTYVMSSATTSYEIDDLMQKVDKPTAIFIGGDDEQFIPEKVIAYQKLIQAPVVAETINNSGHLSILLQAPQLITDYIHEFSRDSQE